MGIHLALSLLLLFDFHHLIVGFLSGLVFSPGVQLSRY